MLKAAVGFLLVLSAVIVGMAQSAHPLYGPQGVSPGAVKQGVLGSCYFHASIAALAMAVPETLRGDIRKNFPIGYKVHFASGSDEAVYPDDTKYGRSHGFDESDGDWVLVLMRAYAQREVRQSLVNSIQRSTIIPAFAKPLALKWLNETDLMLVAYDRAIRPVVQQDGSMDKESLKQSLAGELRKIGVPAEERQMLVGFLDEEGFFSRIALTVQQNGEVFGAYKGLGQGGIPVRVIEAFMGSAHALVVDDHEMTMDHLRRLHQGGMAMVAGSWARTPSGLANASWWVEAHAYTVLDYNETTQTVSMRNPWGSRPGPNGFFTLPLATFFEGFESASFSDAP
jgi:hypothetical protein